MGGTEYIDGRLQAIIPLQVKPYSHQAVPTITGSPVTNQAGTVLYGYYGMDYRLPDGDCLRMVANHNKGTVQLFLLTTQTAHWFIEQGFVQGKLEDLPIARQELYNYQRNSKIFVKDLN